MIVVCDCISLYRVIVSVNTADEHKVKESKLDHSSELCSYDSITSALMILLNTCINMHLVYFCNF